jgi:hypothetical protein
LLLLTVLAGSFYLHPETLFSREGAETGGWR